MVCTSLPPLLVQPLRGPCFVRGKLFFFPRFPPPLLRIGPSSHGERFFPQEFRLCPSTGPSHAGAPSFKTPFSSILLRSAASDFWSKVRDFPAPNDISVKIFFFLGVLANWYSFPFRHRLLTRALEEGGFLSFAFFLVCLPLRSQFYAFPFATASGALTFFPLRISETAYFDISRSFPRR